MKQAEDPKLFYPALAVLPFSFFARGWQEGLIAAGVIAAGVWSTALIFSFARPLFPKRMFDAALIVWLAALAQAGLVLYRFPVYWAVGVYLILRPSVPGKKEGRRDPFEGAFGAGLAAALWFFVFSALKQAGLAALAQCAAACGAMAAFFLAVNFRRMRAQA